MRPRRLKLSLNEFATLPASLRAAPNAVEAVTEVSVDLGLLYHHYYMDSYGVAPPSPDPAQFEYLRFLVDSAEFVFLGEGLGRSSGGKRNRSMELGQAFCRWFLHEHLDVVYFAPIEDLLDGQPKAEFDGLILARSAEGDTPDFLCRDSGRNVTVAEAKGSYAPSKFGSAKFREWRKQFDRILVKAPSGAVQTLKGHIVETAWATESNGRATSELLVEDPQTPGDMPFSGEQTPALGRAIVANHYSRIFSRLNVPLLSSALRYRFVIPDELRFGFIRWACLVPPFQGRTFLGGYYANSGSTCQRAGRSADIDDPLDLARVSRTFVGIEEGVASTAVAAARRGLSVFDRLEPAVHQPRLPSGLSYLRDGSVIGPVEFFRPLEVINL